MATHKLLKHATTLDRDVPPPKPRRKGAARRGAVSSPPVKRPVVRRRGIRLGLNMAAPRLDPGGHEDT